MPKIGCCWIWESPFCFTEAAVSAMNLKHPDGSEVQFFRGRGWSPARRHQMACEDATEWGADWIVILGADQVYPHDTLVRLMGHTERGCAIVAAMVPGRGPVAWEGAKAYQPMAWRFISTDENGQCLPYRGQDLDGHLVEVIVPDGTLQRADFIGSGCLLFHRDLLLNLKKPWFSEQIDWESQQRIACMDSRFVWRLQTENGVQLWVDTSIKIGHQHVFEIDETFQDRYVGRHG